MSEKEKAVKVQRHVVATATGFHGGQLREPGAKFFIEVEEGKKLPHWVKDLEPGASVPAAASDEDSAAKKAKGDKKPPVKGKGDGES